MRAPQLVSDFFEWRWAPCVGLTAGSLAFVASALVLIPARFGGEPRGMSTLRSFEIPQPQQAIFSSSLTRGVTEPVERRRADDLRVTRSSPPANPPSSEQSAPPQRGFSPVLERAEPIMPAPPPAPPTPPAPPNLEPPAPAPGTVVVIQPEPGGQSREVITQ